MIQKEDQVNRVVGISGTHTTRSDKNDFKKNSNVFCIRIYTCINYTYIFQVYNNILDNNSYFEVELIDLNGEMVDRVSVKIEEDKEIIEMVDDYFNVVYIDYGDMGIFITEINNLSMDTENDIYIYIFINNNYLYNGILEATIDEDDVLSFRLHYYGNIVY